jgi:3-oxoacyl-[acyl-carrier protein] reductase
VARDRTAATAAGEVAISRQQGPALVGGAAGGIGRAVTRRLAEAGHDVVLVGRTADTLAATATEVATATGRRAYPLVADLADPLAAAALPERAAALAGPPDVVVLNAGGPPPGRVLDVTDDGWAAGLDLLLRAPLALARAVLPGMCARGYGRLVVVTSTAVRQPQPDLAVSVVARAAMTAAAKLLANEVAADGVTVTCVAPGATATPRRREILTRRAEATGTGLDVLERADVAAVPAGRPGAAEEIAEAVAWLASPASGYVTGTVLTVDGGRTETIW